MAPVWLYVPNLIGYTRVVTGLAAFAYAFTDPNAFFLLYSFSYALDAVDGVAARALNQKSSFGAVLDMVTDRFCTAGLLAVLAHLFPTYSFLFIALLILDVTSHWVQMYSSLASGAESHKAIADDHPILRFYYSYPYALFFVCLFNEAALVMLYCVGAKYGLSQPGFSALSPLFADGTVPLVYQILYLSAPVALLKQAISVVQLINSARRVVAMDEAKRR